MAENGGEPAYNAERHGPIARCHLTLNIKECRRGGAVSKMTKQEAGAVGKMAKHTNAEHRRKQDGQIPTNAERQEGEDR